jgi:MFS family permease
MIVFRALQGVFGGVLIPTAFTAAVVLFQGKQKAVAASCVSAAAGLAPALGPVIGGWITEDWSWHWLFYINIVPGTAVAVLAPAFVRMDEPDLTLLQGADYLGMILMAVCLGCLEYVLEDGARWEWFSDDTVRMCAWIAALTGAGFVIRSLTKSASGLFALMRNLGGAIGIAACATIVNDRTNLHFLHIAEHLNSSNTELAGWLHRMASRYIQSFGDPTAGQAAALKKLWEAAYREAQVQAHADAYLAIAVCFVVSAMMVPLMRGITQNQTGKGGR